MGIWILILTRTTKHFCAAPPSVSRLSKMLRHRAKYRKIQALQTAFDAAMYEIQRRVEAITALSSDRPAMWRMSWGCDIPNIMSEQYWAERIWIRALCTRIGRLERPGGGWNMPANIWMKKFLTNRLIIYKRLRYLKKKNYGASKGIHLLAHSNEIPRKKGEFYGILNVNIPIASSSF